MTGKTGDHAMLSVEVGIKQEPDDATTLLLRAVERIVRVTLQIANLVI